MRILLVAPEPAFKGMALAREMKRRGHEMTVLTGFPTYPGSQIFPGYCLRPIQRETQDGITIIRTVLYPSHNSSALGRVANYVSFALTAAIMALFVRRPDIVYLCHPPGIAALPALLLKWLRGVPFVLDVQDMWPDTLAVTGMMKGRRVFGMVGQWMQVVYRAAAHIVVVSEGFQRLMLSRGVPPEKVSVIPNWTYDQQATAVPNPALAADLGFTGRFNIVFAGTMGNAQAMETVIFAAELLSVTWPEVRFVMIGGGIEKDRLQAMAAERCLSNVAFLERRPPPEIPPILALADALLVHLRDDPLFEITMRSETQAYLQAGRPILMGVRGDTSSIISDAGTGFAFSPECANDLAAAVERMISLPAEERWRIGDACRRRFEEDFALEAGITRWLACLERARFAAHRRYIVKRALDILASLCLLVAFSVPMLIVAWAVARKLGRPVVFSQERPGRHGKPFIMYKFRTMTDANDGNGLPLPDRERLTPFGMWLRTTSLDELPSLLNVLRGDMSMVGPRPLLMRYTQFFTPEERIRLLVRPGLTGWAQINGRNHASWDYRLGLDAWYVRNWKLSLDLRILLLTVLHVFQRKDIVPDAESIMQNLDDERRTCKPVRP